MGSVSTPDTRGESSFWTSVSRHVGHRDSMGSVWLQNRLPVFDHEFEVFVEDVRRTDPDRELFWADECDELLAAARTALEEGRIGAGWRLLHAAERVSYRGLDVFDRTTPEGTVVNPRIETQSRLLLEQAREDLVGWRLRSVEALLTVEDDADRRVPNVDALAEAHRLIHERHEDVHLLRRSLLTQFEQLMLLGLGSGVAFLVLAALAEAGVGGLVSPFAATSDDVRSVGFAVFVVLAGVVGASIFGMRSLRTQPLSTQLSQMIERIHITGARGVVGGIAAGLFYFLLGTELLAQGTPLPAVYIAVGFAAGYSERMVPAAVDQITAITGAGSSETDS